jgi:glucosyl-3-phosphoglycerate synthase
MQSTAVSGLDELVAAKQKSRQRVSVCIPCRNEADTIGPIVESIVSHLTLEPVQLVDELLVIDDGSTDATAQTASAAGASVVAVSDVLPHLAGSHGKGAALWASTVASTGDIIVWCDGDLLSFDPFVISRLVGPLLNDPAITMVKGFYERPLDQSGEGGGRVTELVARPLLRLVFPALSEIRQPLGGEYAIRRSAIQGLSFEPGYGVEAGLLIDVAVRHGAASIAQVDLGVRRHRHRSLSELSVMSETIIECILRRAFGC